MPHHSTNCSKRKLVEGSNRNCKRFTFAYMVNEISPCIPWKMRSTTRWEWKMQIGTIRRGVPWLASTTRPCNGGLMAQGVSVALPGVLERTFSKINEIL
ncbi:hypothetical protein V1478_004512 [Vespula squamosa]|uniref:Uncharacterized protein n=1 Tax=Vespula squamosa TaxID=30214 RepID=A0ABD2BGD9_VESSQ